MKYSTPVLSTGSMGCVVVLLQAVLLLQLAATDVAGLKLTVPLGVVDGQLVLNQGSSLALSCDNTGELYMWYPIITRRLRPLPEEDYTCTGSRCSYRLVLHGLQPAHTGFYNCSSASNPADVQSLYLYVRSNKRDLPWVLDTDEMRQKKVVSQYSAPLHTTATLDCRANDPTTTVHLRDSNNNTLALGHQPDGTELTWNPRFGFHFGPVEMRHSGTYWCAAVGRIRNLQVKLQVVGVEIMPPSVQLGESNVAARGSNVTIKCELAVMKTIDFNLTWTSPVEQNQTNRIYSRETKVAVNDSTGAWHKATKLLRIFDMQDVDTGDYTCTVDDGRGNRKSTTFILEMKGAATRVPQHQHEEQDSSRGGKLHVNTSLIAAALCILCLKLQKHFAVTLQG